MKRYIANIHDSVINPPEDAELAEVPELPNAKLQTLWLLGKTGAGKPTIVRTITGESAATIGSAFEPCTRNA